LGDNNELNWDVTNATTLSVDQGVGTLSGTALANKKVSIKPTAVGAQVYKLTAGNAKGSTTATVRLVTLPANAGLSADYPPFQTEQRGAFQQAWGGGGYWPQQLFWELDPIYKDSYSDMVNDADGRTAGGSVAALGLVSWGFDLLLGNGGSVSDGIADYSGKPAFKAYANWMNPRAADYFAQDDTGTVRYVQEGYVSFGMPMLPADISNGKSSQTYGEWAGERVGKLALYLHCNGVFGADGFIGLNFYTDWHPRLIDAFEKWSGITVPGSTVAARHDFIVANCLSKWYDFWAHGQASFFCTAGQVILAGGKQPLVGGQYPNIPAIGRFSGDDPRIWQQHLDPKYLLFYVENQSAGDRDTPPMWTAVASLGATASRSPQVNIGAFNDASIQDYWGAVKRASWSEADGWKYLKHVWLATAWVHTANIDGTVRRAAKMFCRSFWDAGGVNEDVMLTFYTHIPRHPFGPAYYYSLAIEKSYEVPPPPDTMNYYPQHWLFLDNVATPTDPVFYPNKGATQGINVGYWVGDEVDLTQMAAADKPSAWLVYALDRMPAAEKAKLEAIAPVIDPAKDPAAALAAGPVRTKGKGLNCIAFVDQNGSVIVMVSNLEASTTAGSLEFTQVSNGSFTCRGLLGTLGGTLSVQNNAGSLPISVEARDTIVLEIPGLKWLGH
jgi:hypothetical protein